MERLPQKILATVMLIGTAAISWVLNRYCCLLHLQKPLARPRYKWLDNIKMDLNKIEYEGVTGFILLRMGTSGRLLSTGNELQRQAEAFLASQRPATWN